MAGLQGHKHAMIAVINIGTCSCDCLFSYKNKPEEVRNLRQQPMSCILFNKKKECIAFGEEAENQYYAICNEWTEKDCYFFRKFKMELFNSYINGKSTIQDVKGRRLSVVHVLSATILHIKEKMIQIWSTTYFEDLVGWILLVPGGWNKALNSTMKEAAKKAGIKEDHFDVISEPDAACMWCHHLYKNVIKYDKLASPLETCTDTLVVDTGCESVFYMAGFSPAHYRVIDITVSVIRSEMHPDMLDEINCWKLGSNPVDQIFNDFLSDVFGADVMDELKANAIEDHTKLFHMFHSKLTLLTGWSDRVGLRIPSELIQGFERKRGIDFKDHIRSNYQNLRQIVDVLKVDGERGMYLMKAAFESVVNSLKHVLGKSQLQDVPTIIMYGWFAESTFLQTIIKELFPDKRVIFPEHNTSAAIKGALLFGHEVSSFCMETEENPSKRKHKLPSQK